MRTHTRVSDDGLPDEPTNSVTLHHTPTTCRAKFYSFGDQIRWRTESNGNTGGGKKTLFRCIQPVVYIQELLICTHAMHASCATYDPHRVAVHAMVFLCVFIENYRHRSTRKPPKSFFRYRHRRNNSAPTNTKPPLPFSPPPPTPVSPMMLLVLRNSADNSLSAVLPRAKKKQNVCHAAVLARPVCFGHYVHTARHGQALVTINHSETSDKGGALNRHTKAQGNQGNFSDTFKRAENFPSHSASTGQHHDQKV